MATQECPVDRTLRLFVALAPPAEVAKEFLRALEALGLTLPPHRLIPHGDQHLTLAFIGETRQKELRHVIESVDRACAGFAPFILNPEALITIPTPDDGGPPRLIAARTTAPSALIEIQRRLAMRLTKPKRNGHRARFLPHVTVARYAHGKTSDPVDLPIAGTPQLWTISEVTLYSSTVRADRAEYQAVHTVSLGH